MQVIERDCYETVSDADTRLLVQIDHGARTFLARRYDEILDFAPAARDLHYLPMSKATFKANAYVKEGCPFSFKYLVFMTEAGLLDDLNIVRLREGDAGFDATKQRLSESIGKPVSFPTVEIEPGRYMTDSDRLIEHYAEQHRLVPDELPVLSLYKQTIFPKLIELHKLKTAKT